MKRLQMIFCLLLLYTLPSCAYTLSSPADEHVFLWLAVLVCLLFGGMVYLWYANSREKNVLCQDLESMECEKQVQTGTDNPRPSGKGIPYQQLHARYDEALLMIENLKNKQAELEKDLMLKKVLLEEAQIQLEDNAKELQTLRKQLDELKDREAKRKRFLSFNPEMLAAVGSEPEDDAGDTPDHEAVLPVGTDGGDELNNEFLVKIIAFMKANIDNAELNIEEFAKHQNISRSNLYRQVKAATGLTPIEFMHKVRISHSIELMKEDYTFSQIAYMSGFNDPKYFSKCFKKYMGMTPTEYRERKC